MQKSQKRKTKPEKPLFIKNQCKRINGTNIIEVEAAIRKCFHKLPHIFFKTLLVLLKSTNGPVVLMKLTSEHLLVQSH